MKDKFCTHCGNKLEQEHEFCPKCGKKIGNDVSTKELKNDKNGSSNKKIGTIILDIIRYGLALIFALGSVSDLMNETFDLSSFIGILFAISLCPFLYRNFLNKYIKSPKVLLLIQILAPIILFILAIIAVPSDETNQNKDQLEKEPEGTVEEKTKWAVSHLLDEASETIKSLELNSETGRYNIVIMHDEPYISAYECADVATTIAGSKGIIGNKNIEKIECECTDKTKPVYYVSVNNIHSLTNENIEENTKYYDANHKEENTNMEKLEARYDSDYKKSCTAFKYKDVLRNPQDYMKSRAYWFGEIVQVVDKGIYGSTFRINVSCEKMSYSKSYYCPDTIYVTYFGTESFIEDDMVKMWGTMEGTETYTTVLGASVTIPKFYAEYIELQ